MIKTICILFLVVIISGSHIFGINTSHTPAQQPPVSRISHLPSDIMEVIKTELYQRDRYVECGEDEQAPLHSQQFVVLHEHTLLLFLGLPDYLCSRTNSFLPLRIDSEGNWRWGEWLPGAPTMFVQETPQQFWLVTQWQVAGSFPSLYYSEDGVHWEKVPLPEHRDIDCCVEFLTDLCIDSQSIFVHFEGGSSGKRGAWKTNIASVVPQPQWQRIPLEDRQEGLCASASFAQGEWIRQEHADTVSFHHPAHSVRIILPKWIHLQRECFPANPCENANDSS